MSELTSGTPVKALDGTIQPVNGAPTVPATSLPTRTKPSSSKDAQLSSRQILTGKQEHCMFHYYAYKGRDLMCQQI